MKLKTTLLLISLLIFAQGLTAQSTISTNPPRLDFDSNPGVTELQVIFEGEPFEWVSDVQGDWVNVTPMTGFGITDLLIEYTENMGPRRTARVTFQAADGLGEPFTLEIRQFQGMPTVMMPVEFSVLEFAHFDNPDQFECQVQNTQ